MWMLAPGVDPSVLGFLPEFLSDTDPRTIKEQIDENYRHGGGWCSHPNVQSFRLNTKRYPAELEYPSDPPLKEFARIRVRHETFILFEAEMCAVVLPDGTFDVCRVD